MAEEATKTKAAESTKNWADMDNDEEDEQEIGVQGAAATTDNKEEEKKDS